MTPRGALVVVCLWLAGCSGSSKSGAPASGGTAGDGGSGSGGGGISGSGGSSGGGESSRGGAGSSGIGGSDAGSAGTTGGTAGAIGTAGGNASGTGGTVPLGGTGGDTGGDAGESAGGTGGTSGTGGISGAGGTGGSCQDLCTETAPACCTEPLRCVESIPTCRIEFLTDRVDTTYEYADLEEKIAALTGGVALTITSDDIEWAAADTPPSPRFEFRLSAEASLRYAALTDLAYSHPFLVSCGNQALFVGITYMFEGAAALRTPVLHVEETETGAFRLFLGAWQGAAGLETSTGDVAARQRIDRPELRAAFCGRGILTEHMGRSLP